MNYQRRIGQATRVLLLASFLGLLGIAPDALCFEPEPLKTIDETTIKGKIELDTTTTTTPVSLPPATPAAQIDELVSRIVEKNDNYSTKTHPILDKVRDMAQFGTTYKGFESSSEAADAILSEKINLKNKAAQEYIKQKNYDSLHSQITACVLQIAMGLGNEDLTKRTQLIDSGVQKLKELVGEKEALNLQDQLVAWANQIKIETPVNNKQAWDILEIQNRSKEVFKSAIQSDKIVEEVINRLHKYNRHSKFSRVGAKVVNTTLSLAALTPTFVAPAAQFTQFVFIALTGGPEESKLLKEVYLDRRLEARFTRLTEEINLAVTNYNLAKITRNPVLLSCSESIINGMIVDPVKVASSLEGTHTTVDTSLDVTKAPNTDATKSMNIDANSSVSANPNEPVKP